MTYPCSASYSATKFAVEGELTRTIPLLHVVRSSCLCLHRSSLVAAFNDALNTDYGMVNPNIRSIVFEPGFFRTQVFAATNMKTQETKSLGEGMQGLEKSLDESTRSIHGTERGDARKAVERMVDVVRGEGMAEGKALPPRLPLGVDSLEKIREKCRETLRLCEEWEPLITSTDYVEGKEAVL